jgi:NitT/TauT family transport system substrate-binding protein
VNLRLITRNPTVNSIRDFTDKDKIALPVALVSVHATTLQRAAAQTFGTSESARLDRLTMTMTPPDALIALTSGTDITTIFTHPPFADRALQRPGTHLVLTSEDVWGGRLSTFLAWTSNRFREANPKTVIAVHRAIREAMAMITEDKTAAAEIYLRVVDNTEDRDAILAEISSPEITYSMRPAKFEEFANFKYEIGAIKARPEVWTDMFFSQSQ